MWRANGNPNPCTNRDEILLAYPHLSKESFWCSFDPHPLTPPGPGGPKILKTVYKTKDIQQAAN